ncbi:hypothetical protein HA466_0058820 [Hirschfeldia incana]|nr:hypothetical protein HA466_0058820 [Hirschfeldia incana]
METETVTRLPHLYRFGDSTVYTESEIITEENGNHWNLTGNSIIPRRASIETNSRSHPDSSIHTHTCNGIIYRQKASIKTNFDITQPNLRNPEKTKAFHQTENFEKIGSFGPKLSTKKRM